MVNKKKTPVSENSVPHSSVSSSKIEESSDDVLVLIVCSESRFSTSLQDLLLVKSMLQREFITSLQVAKSSLENLADSQLLDLIGGKGMLYVPMIKKRYRLVYWL